MKNLEPLFRRVERLEEQHRTKTADAQRRSFGISSVVNFSRSPEEAADFERRVAECPPHLRPRNILHVKIWPGSWRLAKAKPEETTP